MRTAAAPLAFSSPSEASILEASCIHYGLRGYRRRQAIGAQPSKAYHPDSNTSYPYHTRNADGVLYLQYLRCQTSVLHAIDVERPRRRVLESVSLGTCTRVGQRYPMLKARARSGYGARKTHLMSPRRPYRRRPKGSTVICVQLQGVTVNGVQFQHIHAQTSLVSRVASRLVDAWEATPSARSRGSLNYCTSIVSLSCLENRRGQHFLPHDGPKAQTPKRGSQRKPATSTYRSACFPALLLHTPHESTGCWVFTIPRHPAIRRKYQQQPPHSDEIRAI